MQSIFITPKGKLISTKLLLPIHPTPRCWHLQMYVLFLWIYLFWIFHINGNIQYVNFCVYFHSFNNIFEIHLCYSIYQYLIYFYGLIFHCMFTLFHLFLYTTQHAELPNQGSNPSPLQWKCRVLTTRPSGKSSYHNLFIHSIIDGHSYCLHFWLK